MKSVPSVHARSPERTSVYRRGAFRVGEGRLSAPPGPAKARRPSRPLGRPAQLWSAGLLACAAFVSPPGRGGSKSGGAKHHRTPEAPAGYPAALVVFRMEGDIARPRVPAMRPILLALLCLTLMARAETEAPRPLLKVTPMDKAVARAVEMLHNTQDKTTGSWAAGRVSRRSIAISSLAVMAFLSAGHVPGEGKYGPTIERGVRWVLAQQRPNGVIAGEGEGEQEMYHHGIATLMLAEVCGMLDAELGKEVRQAVEKIGRAHV